MKEMRCLHCYSNEFSERNGHLYCVYCGSKYRQRPEDQEILLSMAYRELRFMNFLDAENAFEDIISRHPDLPEAYWGCVCARYGIKFEQDYTGRQIPTCCLPAIESILEDRYYQKALELSDEETAEWYRGQGEYLERVRKTWIERARKLAPYDVFISYKDSDQEKGLDRTEDSLKAQSIYTHLVTQGYSVFYSRESLSNVIGEKYEPYIFQALSTSRAMIVYGSTPEYINSTWVRNEWQRYAKKMQKGEKDKGSLIVICDGFSPKDLPPMLRSMQVLDGRDMFCYSKLDEHLKTLFSAKPNGKKEIIEPSSKKETPKAEERAKEKKTDANSGKGNRKKFAVMIAVLMILGICIFALSALFGTGTKEPAKIPVQTETSIRDLDDSEKLETDELEIVTDEPVSEEASLAEPETVEPETVEPETVEPETEEPAIPASEGLEFTSNGDGTCYVSGIGSCTDTEIVIPKKSPEGDSVTRIVANPFMYCDNVTSITIPDSVTSIDGSAFFGCSALPSITIPDSVTSIGEGAFGSCEALTSIKVDENNTVYHDAGNCLIETASKTLIAGCQTSVIPTDGSVTSIGKYVFYECDALTSITIPDSVTSIGYAAFYECSALPSITIPDSVTNIADGAFAFCSRLTSIEIPDSATSIGDLAFNFCESLTSITFKGTKAEWKAIEKGNNWNQYTGSYTVHCTDGDIPKSES